MKPIEEIMEFLDKNTIQIFTTLSNNMPYSRPMGSLMLHDERLWYCTTNDKQMFKQIEENPNVCICVCGSDFSWLRLNALAVFEDNKEIKSLYVQQTNNRFTDINDPHFYVFYLKDVIAALHIKGEVKEWHI